MASNHWKRYLSTFVEGVLQGVCGDTYLLCFSGEINFKKGNKSNKKTAKSE